MEKLAQQLGEAVTAMRETVERQDEEIKKLSKPLALTQETIKKQSEYVTELKGRLDDLETKVGRQALVKPGDPEPQSEEAKARNAAFYKWIRGGITSLEPQERKALVEDTTGQYLITPELDTEIVRALPKITVIRALATVRTIGKDQLKIRSISEVSVGWGKLETGTNVTESDLTPGAPTYQYVEDLYGLTKIGEDELMDSDFNLQAILADSFTRAIAEAEDLKFVKGAGHSSEEPEGITINAQLITDTITGAVINEVAIEDFLDMIYACPSQYRRNGVFIINSATELAIRKLRAVDGSGTKFGPFLWEPSIQAGRPNTFLGYGVYTQDDMETLTGTVKVIAIFGDMKAGYRIIDRAGITLQRLTELYSEAGLVGFKVHKRVSGAVMRASQKPLVLLTEKS